MFTAELDALAFDSRKFATGTFTVEDTSVVGVFGKNGVGKSTVMRALAGLGECPVNRIYRGDRMEPTDRRVHIVFQKNNLIPWLTVFENISLSKRVFSGRDESQETIACLRQFGLDKDEFTEKWPLSLSGGQTRIVELARACRGSERGLLILDEPFTGLDYYYQARVEELIRGKLRKIYSAIVLVSHDLRRLAALTTKVYVFLRDEEFCPLYLAEINRNLFPTVEAYMAAIEETFSAATGGEGRFEIV